MLRGWLLSAVVLLASCAPQPQPSRSVAVPITTYEPPQPQAAAPLPPPPDRASQLGASRRDDVAVARFREALAELEKIRREHPDRYEAIYNEAILIDEYAMLLSQEDYYPALEYAAELYRTYLQKAANDPDAGDALRIARERLERIAQVTHCDFLMTDVQRKDLAIEEKQRAAEEEVRRMEEEDERNGKK